MTAAALRYPSRAVRLLTRPVLLLLFVVMPLTAAATAGAAMLLGVPLVLALVIGACLCPTDPVLAASVITGQPAKAAIPERARQLLTRESRHVPGTTSGKSDSTRRRQSLRFAGQPLRESVPGFQPTKSPQR